MTDMMVILLLILILSVFQVTMIDYLYNNPTFYQLDAYTWESDDFRSLKLGKMVAEWDLLDYDTLTSLMVEHQYDLTGVTDSDTHTDRLLKVKPAEYRKLRQAYETILYDLKFFPIPLSLESGSPDISYQNGWMDNRTYGGDRGHEGCDIMGEEQPRGHYPVVSISDGVVEKVGWLEKGGWRIGIRTPKGAYLYYAHLYGYSRQWKEGDEVTAGELLGFMGDTGYSQVEGTTGNFPVHLHLGIYLRTDHNEEMSVNPYWVLKYLEKYRLKYSY
nr:M23 family metallopeptidase [Lacrimispora celerecrescens]